MYPSCDCLLGNVLRLHQNQTGGGWKRAGVKLSLTEHVFLRYSKMHIQPTRWMVNPRASWAGRGT